MALDDPNTATRTRREISSNANYHLPFQEFVPFMTGTSAAITCTSSHNEMRGSAQGETRPREPTTIVKTEETQPSGDGKQEPALSRRDVIKGFAKAAGAVAVGAASISQAAEQTPGAPESCVAKNPYGGGPNTGITLPPYYRPTPSVANANTFFPGMEELGADEMRISFVGSTPVPPTLAQAGTAIMVELGNGNRFFFDVGPGCLRNIVALQS